MMQKFIDALDENVTAKGECVKDVLTLDPATGYYIVDEATLNSMLGKGLIDEVFRLKNLQQRKLFLNDEIGENTVCEIIRHILQFNAEDIDKPAENRQPILLYLVSDGGDVDCGFELIDAIETSVTPVYTINLGYQYSMGFLIGLAGHKRYAMPNAKFLLHDGSTCVYNSTNKAQDQMKFQAKVEEKIRQYILKHSSLTIRMYNKKRESEWYMFAEEAKELGFTDYIVGVDCPIDEIV